MCEIDALSARIFGLPVRGALCGYFAHTRKMACLNTKKVVVASMSVPQRCEHLYAGRDPKNEFACVLPKLDALRIGSRTFEVETVEPLFRMWK